MVLNTTGSTRVEKKKRKMNLKYRKVLISNLRNSSIMILPACTLVDLRFLRTVLIWLSCTFPRFFLTSTGIAWILWRCVYCLRHWRCQIWLDFQCSNDFKINVIPFAFYRSIKTTDRKEHQFRDNGSECMPFDETIFLQLQGSQNYHQIHLPQFLSHQM